MASIFFRFYEKWTSNFEQFSNKYNFNKVEISLTKDVGPFIEKSLETIA